MERLAAAFFGLVARIMVGGMLGRPVYQLWSGRAPSW
jgi:hypothetical protein